MVMKASQLDRRRLKQLVKEHGGTVRVAYESRIGQSTLVKLIGGTYKSVLSKNTVDKFREYFKEDLFSKGRTKLERHTS